MKYPTRPYYNLDRVSLLPESCEFDGRLLLG